ncbi:unnamed protein product, partial [Onchocerca flexuosa]|uniref:CLP1_P domain-containing protein n=1 Tax=Onchocerca flexuosa TaxID=387005 RepID=A0A183HCA2_9BILA
MTPLFLRGISHLKDVYVLEESHYEIFELNFPATVSGFGLVMQIAEIPVDLFHSEIMAQLASASNATTTVPLYALTAISVNCIMHLFTSINHLKVFSAVQIMKDFISWPRRCKIHNKPINDGAYVLGIAGCSNSGKTTLSKILATALINEGMQVAVLCQDAFYCRQEQLERIVSSADPKIIFYNYDTVKA